MASSSFGDSLTELLQRYGRGDREVENTLFRQILPRLRHIASGQLKKERFAWYSSLDLVHELWVKNLHRGGWAVNNREHFYAIASNAMRRLLIDLARKRRSAPDEYGQIPGSLDKLNRLQATEAKRFEDVIQIDLFMERLERQHPQEALIFNMHYFGGCSFKEIAKTLGLTVRQVGSRHTQAELIIKGYWLDHTSPQAQSPVKRLLNRWRFFRRK